MDKSKYLEEKKKKLGIYKALFATDDGKFVLDDLRKAFGDRISFVRGDAHETAFREGQRDVYLRIKTLIETDLGKYLGEKHGSKD